MWPKCIGEVTFTEKFVVYVEKIKVKVYVNKEISITYKDTTRLLVYDFSLRFPHELLMTF